MTLETSPAAEESIGQRLRRLRLERGLSQRDLASPGVSYAYISRIEAGARRPSVKALRMLAPKLGVSVEYLETGSEIRDVEARELRLADAELELRLTDDTTAAEQTLLDVIEEAVRSGDPLAATRARLALGLAAARRGDHARAVAHLEPAAEAGSVSLTARPDVYSTLGRSYAATGAPEQAVELFERCLDAVREDAPDQTAAQVRYATELSYALTDLGDFERAQEVLREALDRSEDLADPYGRIRLYWSLGRIESHRGNPMAGLECLRRAVALLEATEDTLHLARAHLGCAWTLLSVSRPEEAAPHLAAAERLFGAHPDPLDLAYLRTEQAKYEVRLGNADEGIARARQALDVLGESDPAEQGGAWWALAEGLALKNEVPAADEAFRRAVELLEAHGQPRECSEALRAWAKLLRSAGRETQALDVLERAADLGVSATPAKAPAER